MKSWLEIPPRSIETPYAFRHCTRNTIRDWMKQLREELGVIRSPKGGSKSLSLVDEQHLREDMLATPL